MSNSNFVPCSAAYTKQNNKGRVTNTPSILAAGSNNNQPSAFHPTISSGSLSNEALKRTRQKDPTFGLATHPWGPAPPHPDYVNSPEGRAAAKVEKSKQLNQLSRYKTFCGNRAVPESYVVQTELEVIVLPFFELGTLESTKLTKRGNILITPKNPWPTGNWPPTESPYEKGIEICISRLRRIHWFGSSPHGPSNSVLVRCVADPKAIAVFNRTSKIPYEPHGEEELQTDEFASHFATEFKPKPVYFPPSGVCHTSQEEKFGTAGTPCPCCGNNFMDINYRYR